MTTIGADQLARVCGGNDRATAKDIKKKLDAANPEQFAKWDKCMMDNEPKGLPENPDDRKTPPAAWRVLFKCSREVLGWTPTQK